MNDKHKIKFLTFVNRLSITKPSGDRESARASAALFPQQLKHSLPVG
jgi:hypothetical protein